jgi:predicted ATPase
MGVVYRAEHLDTGIPAAVKTVRLVKESLLTSFRREVRALALLDHPGVVRVVDDGVHEGLPWYAMELVDGATLGVSLGGAARDAASLAPTVPKATDGTVVGDSKPTAAARLTRDDALVVVRRLCETLSFVHGEGIVHRDLKPDNVIVRPDRTPVLVDFGIVAHFAGPSGREALGLATNALGTVAYMAPEQINGEFVDARADLYALGCILYEILTGAPPFGRRDYFETLVAHVTEKPRPPSRVAQGVPARYDDLVLALLAKRPADRIGYAVDIAAALAELDGDEGAPVERSSKLYLYGAGFAGREDALRELTARLDDEEAGVGVVLVGGESGVGKTRLLIECARIAPIRRFRVLVGECFPAGEGGEIRTGAPLEPLRRALQAVADYCREQGTAESERVVGPRGRVLAAYEPSLATLPGQEAYPEPVELPAPAARLRLFRYVAATFAALAERESLLLLLDDLQWADELTLGYLEFLLARSNVYRTRILVVATYRNDEAGDRLEAVLGAPGAGRIALGRLAPEAVASVVGDMLALASVPGYLGDFVNEQSEGNPFFVAEYLRAALESGALGRDEAGVWRLGEAGVARPALDRLGLPRSLRALIERRLESLPTVALEVAEAAAVLGRDVPAAPLAAVVGAGEELVLDAVTVLVRRQVLEDVGGRLRFSHDKVREVAYARLEGDRRARLHRLAAEALESSADHTSSLAAIGRHWREAGEWARAGTCFLEAARLASSQYAYGEAERLYREALTTMSGPAAEFPRARNELATILFRTGRAPEALAEHARALGEARGLGDHRVEAATLRLTGIIERETGRIDEAARLLERALEMARESSDRGEEGIVLGELAILNAVQGRFADAERLFEEVVAVARETGDVQLEGRHLGNLALVNTERGDVERSLELYEEAIALTRAAGDRRSEAINLGNLAVVYGDQLRFAEARKANERALTIHREIGNRQFEGVAVTDLAYIEGQLGRLERARALYDEALDIHREVRNRRFEAATLAYRAAFERRDGNLDLADRMASDAQEIMRQLGDPANVAVFGCELGHVALARGESADGFLADAEQVRAAVNAGAASPLGRAIARLRRAVEARAAVRPLAFGECVEDLSPGVRAQLARDGKLPEDPSTDAEPQTTA